MFAADVRIGPSFKGDLIDAADPRYDTARALFNGAIDKRPALIARCANAADVIAAVNFARDNRLLLAVRGGGHSSAGLGSCDGGLMIDLSRMKDIQVDSAARTVRIEAGCTLADVDHATAAFGLAVPSGIFGSTGIAGLTLGGGHGNLSRAHGLTIDNLIEADVVLADGRLVVANAGQNEDLFWALRGGGGNFGVVTRFLIRAHPASTVYAGPIFWEVAHARDIMRFYREFLPRAATSLYPFLALKSVPMLAPYPEALWDKKVCSLFCCYNGAATDGEQAIRPLRGSLPAPILDWVRPIPFATYQTMFDDLLPRGLQWYWKGGLVNELSDAAIEVHIQQFLRAPSNQSFMHLYPIDGAVRNAKPRDTAWSARDATWSMLIAGIDPSPHKTALLKRWGRAYWEAVRPYGRDGSYVNFMDSDERIGRMKASYGENYARLVAVKTKYDPANVFRVNQNIQPIE